MGRPPKEKPNRVDGIYEVKVTIGKNRQGKLLRKSFYSSVSKPDARAKAETWKLNNKVEEVTGVSINPKTMTFDVWADKWLRAYKKHTVSPLTYESTYRNYVDNHLVPYFGKSELAVIKPADIQILYNELSKTMYQSTLDKVRLCLNGIFETAIANDVCIKNPCKGVVPKSDKTSTAKRVYDCSDCYTLMRYAKRHEYGIYIMLLLCMGLRRGELCGLQWDDIDIDNKVLHIRRAVSRDGNKPILGVPKTKTSVRDLPFSTSFGKYLAQQKAQKSGYIVTNLHGDIMLPSSFMKNRYNKFMKDFQEYQKNRGAREIEILNPHELRHTCGTLLYQHTQNISAVSKFLGHADVQITTKIYIHSDVNSLRDSLNLR